MSIFLSKNICNKNKIDISAITHFSSLLLCLSIYESSFTLQLLLNGVPLFLSNEMWTVDFILNSLPCLFKLFIYYVALSDSKVQSNGSSFMT